MQALFLAFFRKYLDHTSAKLHCSPVLWTAPVYYFVYVKGIALQPLLHLHHDPER